MSDGPLWVSVAALAVSCGTLIHTIRQTHTHDRDVRYVVRGDLLRELTIIESDAYELIGVLSTMARDVGRSDMPKAEAEVRATIKRLEQFRDEMRALNRDISKSEDISRKTLETMRGRMEGLRHAMNGYRRDTLEMTRQIAGILATDAFGNGKPSS